MTDKDSKPKLDPRYAPATENSKILVEFSGNTARIADLSFFQVDAFQLVAIGDYLLQKGRLMIAGFEADMARKAMQSGIHVAGRIPEPHEMPPGFVPPK